MSGQTHARDDEFRIGRRDALITRVVDGEATDEEWAEFRAMADVEVPGEAPCAWRELAKAQRDQALLASVVGDQLAAAERIEAPARGLRLVGGGASHARTRVLAFSGWAAVAAAVALAWVNGWVGAPQIPATPVQQAGMVPEGYVRVQSPDDAVKAYIERCGQEGRIVQDVPQRLLVQARPKQGQPGVYEVVYVRQFLEKAEIRDLHRFGQDEAGNPRAVPATPGRGIPVSYRPG